MRILFLFIFFTVAGFAQTSNFFVKQNSLTWENVFITDKKDIAALIQKHPRLSITASEGGTYKGHGSEVKHTCPDTSPFMEKELSFDFEIVISEGKYRVSITNIKYTSNSKKGAKAIIKPESMWLANGQINKNYNNDLACLNSYFNRIFTMASVYKNKS
ncbi:MAG: hypothetical protein CMP77_03295 [Flavobacterium sp.]|nr:hypothetical protein [Flavobacterium sp.]